MIKLDHLAVASSELGQGVAWVEDTLGVPMVSGGKHARYGTHNSLLGLADGLYLEVIAVDPDAAIDGPRWFNLDHFEGPPRLTNWICRMPDISAAPDIAGPPVDLERNDLRWQITVPDDGSLPHGGAFPTLIEWGAGVSPPGESLPQSGCRLIELIVSHPDSQRIASLIDLNDPLVRWEVGPPGFQATIETPHGIRVLQ